jgi:uncharacterized protein YbjT (DUF2867 family)
VRLSRFTEIATLWVAPPGKLNLFAAQALMRILVTGAYGLIGSACLTRLRSEGHELIGLGRSIEIARRRFPYARWIQANFVQLPDPIVWQTLLEGIDAVVNCVGVLQNGLGDSVKRVQLDATLALFKACERAGVRRVIHISALGVADDGSTVFSQTKAAAEAHLQTMALDWVILRPALVMSHAAYGGTAMLRGLAAFPGFVPLACADAKVQVIGIDDVSETVARAIAPDAPARVVWDLAHPQVRTLASIVVAIRAWLGMTPRRVLKLPRLIGNVAATIGDAVGWFGWRSPLRSTSLAQLDAGVVGDPTLWMTATGITPASLEQILAARPGNVQDRWFARLYLLKPLAFLGLAAIIIAQGLWGLIIFWRLRDTPYGIWSARLFPIILPYLAYDFLAPICGVALLFRRTARIAILSIFVLTLLQLADHVIRPGQHFTGFAQALAFDTPMLLALLFTLAILDDR